MGPTSFSARLVLLDDIYMIYATINTNKMARIHIHVNILHIHANRISIYIYSYIACLTMHSKIKAMFIVFDTHVYTQRYKYILAVNKYASNEIYQF